MLSRCKLTLNNIYIAVKTTYFEANLCNDCRLCMKTTQDANKSCVCVCGWRGGYHAMLFFFFLKIRKVGTF